MAEKPKRGLHSPLRGRPSKYKEEFGQMLIDTCAKGGFIQTFCMEVDIHIDTLLDWTTKYPEFSESYKKARLAQEKHYMELGYGLATGRVKGQVAAWCFMMKNMFGWRDSKELELSGSTNNNQKLVIVSSEEAEENE